MGYAYFGKHLMTGFTSEACEAGFFKPVARDCEAGVSFDDHGRNRAGVRPFSKGLLMGTPQQ